MQNVFRQLWKSCLNATVFQEEILWGMGVGRGRRQVAEVACTMPPLPHHAFEAGVLVALCWCPCPSSVSQNQQALKKACECFSVAAILSLNANCENAKASRGVLLLTNRIHSKIACKICKNTRTVHTRMNILAHVYAYVHANTSCISRQQMLLLEGLWVCNILEEEREVFYSTSLLSKRPCLY